MLRNFAQAFQTRFGGPPAVAARAPGRVNLIGEHTDYNEGLALPCAIDRDTIVLAAPRAGGRVRVHSRELGEERSFDTDRLQRRGDWLDHVQGVCFALAEGGAQLSGFDLAIASDVPPEAGLSSSAALALALVTALDRCIGLALDATARARIAHRAENVFVGSGCGILDPFACALAERGAALRIDCRSGETEPIPLPVARLRLLIAHSGVARTVAGSAYGDRRRECRAALDAARAAGIAPSEASALGELSPADLPALEAALEPLPFRRARHVITENARVDAACAAFARGDLEAAGAVLCAGMASLRDDFDASLPELDALCEIGDAQPGVFGSRITGAGFGGCTLHLVDPDAAGPVGEAIARGFASRFGRRPTLLETSPGAGAGILSLD